jgi:hypothetical protein
MNINHIGFCYVYIHLYSSQRITANYFSTQFVSDSATLFCVVLRECFHMVLTHPFSLTDICLLDPVISIKLYHFTVLLVH